MHVHSLIIATLFPSTDRTIPAVNYPNNVNRPNTALQMSSAPSSSGPVPVTAATTSPISTDPVSIKPGTHSSSSARPGPPPESSGSRHPSRSAPSVASTSYHFSSAAQQHSSPSTSSLSRHSSGPDHTCIQCSQSAVKITLLERAERDLRNVSKSTEADLARHKKLREQDQEKIKKLETEVTTNKTERGKQGKRIGDLEKEAAAYRAEKEQQERRITELESEAAAYKAEKENQIKLLQAEIDLADRDKTIALQQLRLELSRPAQDSTRPESTTSASASPSWTTSACDLTSAAQPSPHQNGPRPLPHRYGPRPQPHRSGPRSQPHRFGPVESAGLGVRG